MRPHPQGKSFVPILLAMKQWGETSKSIGFLKPSTVLEPVTNQPAKILSWHHGLSSFWYEERLAFHLAGQNKQLPTRRLNTSDLGR